MRCGVGVDGRWSRALLTSERRHASSASSRRAAFTVLSIPRRGSAHGSSDLARPGRPRHGRGQSALRAAASAAQADGMTPQLMTPAPHGRPETFDPEDLRAVPAAARRWLGHAITPGAVVPAAIEMQLHGEIRIDRWRRFTALQALVPGSSFVWWARTRIGAVPISGFDSYVGGRGLMRWRAFGVIPVLRAHGFDVTASAADRLAAESVLVPPALIRAEWLPGSDEQSAAFVDPSGTSHRHPPVTVRVGPDGRLLGVSMQRWGNPDNRKFGLHRFDVQFDAEFDAGEFRVADGMRAAWVDDTGQRNEFYRAEIDSVLPLKPSADR